MGRGFRGVLFRSQVAESLGTLATALDENEAELSRFVSDTAELSTRAAELLDTEGARLDRILSDSLSVLELVNERPGAVAALLNGAPRFVNGLAAATGTGAFRAPIANFAVLNPGSLLDAKGELGEAQGGAGIGPDLTVEGFPLTAGVVTGPESGEYGRSGAGNGVGRRPNTIRREPGRGRGGKARQKSGWAGIV